MSDERMERLEGELVRLQDLVTSLTLSVQYGGEEPFEAFLARNGIAGDKRAALNLVIGAILSRAVGAEPALVRNAEILEAFPAIRAAQRPGPVDVAEAVTLVGAIVGTQARAIECFAAHRARGLGREGHEALGI